MKGFSGQDLETLEINTMALVKLQITPGKIIPHDAD